jgi:hypothetical protein
MRHNSRAKAKGGMGAIIGIVALAVILGFNDGISSSDSSAVDTCNDGIDNDGDGNIDTADAECFASSPVYDGDENDPFDGQGPP